MATSIAHAQDPTPAIWSVPAAAIRRWSQRWSCRCQIRRLPSATTSRVPAFSTAAATLRAMKLHSTTHDFPHHRGNQLARGVKIYLRYSWVRRVMEVAATAPPYPSESDLAAAEVAPCAWGRSGGRMRHLLASRPQSSVAAVRAALPCWIR
uniref:Uncharacterized protein n=1 Tax=Oryza glumipatula TaxID=40148 RepID=A0A0D9ZGR5_9ORYZ